MRDHTKLRAFELADELAMEVYRLTRAFPPEEACGLTSQIRRAAVSVPSNIVEGCARESSVEYQRFLTIAYGSLRELRYQFSLATQLGYLDQATGVELDALLLETEKVLNGLIRSLRSVSNLQPSHL